ncbi:cation:proton antiporter domain-containing protein [Solimonas marina]|uniref:Sodium:proton antiporter n=1 Tax=Solimonas marina TaxID=2714601 RepID=A0A970BBG3_9GAMM|nr:cation:proton antiporter [Solimonas marina]NKF24396.1 sodium:proton antiporter [Solimonas marina]
MPGTMTEFYIAILIVSLVLLLLAAASGLVNDRLWLSEPMLCVAIGIAVGPLGFGWLAGPLRQSHIEPTMIEAARLALSIAVVGAALRLPTGYVRRAWRELAVILGAGMLMTWLLGAALAMLILGWAALPALLLAATLAPTDPVLAASIVTGRFADDVIPDRLRNTISAEAGANDGLALPFVLIPAALLVHRGAVHAAWTMWWQTFLWEVGVALLIGTATGYLSGHLLRWASRLREAETTSLVTIALSLAFATMAACRLLETDGILACFVAGVWLNESLIGSAEERHDRFHQAISRFFELPFFVFFGVMLPWSQWREIVPLALPFAFALLFIRRPLAWWLLWRWLPSLRSTREHLFVGWFGPIGIAAVFYAMQWGQKLQIPLLWPVVSLVAALSLLLHGITATPLSRVLVGRDGRAAKSSA